MNLGAWIPGQARDDSHLFGAMDCHGSSPGRADHSRNDSYLFGGVNCPGSKSGAWIQGQARDDSRLFGVVDCHGSSARQAYRARNDSRLKPVLLQFPYSLWLGPSQGAQFSKCFSLAQRQPLLVFG